MKTVVIISGSQESDLAMHMGVSILSHTYACIHSLPYIYMYRFSPKLPSHPGWHTTLSRAPCAIH